jgi:flagellar biosynthesis/type III secretory pathway ATPase
MPDVTSPEHQESIGTLRDILATYRSAEDLINIGAYVDGSNPKIDHAKAHIDAVNAFLRQGISEEAPYAETVAGLQSLFKVE